MGQWDVKADDLLGAWADRIPAQTPPLQHCATCHCHQAANSTTDR